MAIMITGHTPFDHPSFDQGTRTMIANCEATTTATVASAAQTTIMHPKTRQTGHNPEQDHHFGADNREIHG
jgi:hypothetical protein